MAQGIAASPGAASGKVVLMAEAAVEHAEKHPNDPIMLVRKETSPEDVAGMHLAKGILTSTGGKASHAARPHRGEDTIAAGAAIVQGVGVTRPDLSHFEMLRRWWAGDADSAHVSLTGFLGRLADRVLGPDGSRWRRFAVFAGAAFWAWHPLRVESVAWVAERKDLVSTCFLFLALIAYARYAARPGARRLALVTILFALGLMAKPMIEIGRAHV